MDMLHSITCKFEFSTVLQREAVLTHTEQLRRVCNDRDLKCMKWLERKWGWKTELGAH